MANRIKNPEGVRTDTLRAMLPKTVADEVRAALIHSRLSISDVIGLLLREWLLEHNKTGG